MVDLRLLGAQVANILGGEYLINEKTASGDSVDITNATEDHQFRILLRSHVKDRTKISIRGGDLKANDGTSYPNTNESMPCIQVSVSRGADVIAREIERRVLPDYGRMILQWADVRDNHNKQILQCETNLHNIADTVGGTIRGESVDVDSSDYKKFGWVNRCQVSADTVELEFRSVPIDLAMRLLKEWKKGQ